MRIHIHPVTHICREFSRPSVGQLTECGKVIEVMPNPIFVRVQKVVVSVPGELFNRRFPSAYAAEKWATSAGHTFDGVALEQCRHLTE